MQKFSIHTHTKSNTAFEMIKRAKELSWDFLGISNHLRIHKNMQKYFNDVNKATDYYKKIVEDIREASIKENITTLVGFEVDFFKSAEWRNTFESLIKELDYDYLIGATHFFYDPNEEHIMDATSKQFENGAFQDLIDNYYDTIKEAIKSGYFTSISHIDWIKHKGLDSKKNWEDKLEIAKLLNQYNTITELNTNGMNKCNEFYPSQDFLIELNKQNVPLIISDDAHSIDRLGDLFDKAEAHLTQIGYKNKLNSNELLSRIRL